MRAGHSKDKGVQTMEQPLSAHLSVSCMIPLLSAWQQSIRDPSTAKAFLIAFFKAKQGED
eukprot:scaffold9084_cov22-Tisochrysis_lutea.AAC.1